MQYTSEVVINAPRAEVVALFSDPERVVEWQPEFRSVEYISGEPGATGSKSKMIYDMNGRKMEMLETIERNDLPDAWVATFETNGVTNVNANRFYEEGVGRTRWVQDNTFKFSGLMSLISLFMRGAFRKQTAKTMNQLKAVAERTS